MPEFIKTLRLLENRRLESIRPGSHLYIRSIDIDAGQVRLTDASGRPRSRSIDELRTLWGMLKREGFIHVDSALGGSGSSRNQPETILANLPTVEWLVVNRKKCLAMVDSPSHPIGSIKKMDEVAAMLLVERHDTPISEVVVSKDVLTVSEVLEREFGVPESVEPGVYKYVDQSRAVLLVREDTLSWSPGPGAYTVVRESGPLQNARRMRLGKYALTCAEFGGVTFFFREASDGLS